MDKATVTALAREAGFHAWYSDPDREYHFGCAMKFAALVAAAEREACARICDKHWDDNGQHCANAIRSRT